MDRLRQAIKKTAMVLQQAVEGCDQFDAGGRVLATAQSVVDAPRIWWCDYWGEGNEWPFCITQDASRHEKCRWVRLVDDPQGSE